MYLQDGLRDFDWCCRQITINLSAAKPHLHTSLRGLILSCVSTYLQLLTKCFSNRILKLCPVPIFKPDRTNSNIYINSIWAKRNFTLWFLVCSSHLAAGLMSQKKKQFAVADHITSLGTEAVPPVSKVLILSYEINILPARDFERDIKLP